MAWIARQCRYADLSEWTIRVIPALAGLALVLVSWALGNLATLGNQAGWGSGAAAALFTAVSPMLAYYSRYYIPEMLLVLFSAGLMLCALAYQKSPGLRWAVAAGVCAGLMYAAKETAVLVFLALAAGCLAARFRFRPVDLTAMAPSWSRPGFTTSSGCTNTATISVNSDTQICTERQSVV